MIFEPTKTKHDLVPMPFTVWVWRPAGPTLRDFATYAEATSYSDAMEIRGFDTHFQIDVRPVSA